MPIMRLTSPPTVTGSEAMAPPATTSAATPPASADVGAVLIGYACVLAGIGLGIAFFKWRNPEALTPAAGISVFAPLYILAQGIERFIEPFTGLIKAEAPTNGGGKVKQNVATESLNVALVAGDATTAAAWQEVVDKIRRNRAVIAWGVASFLGIVLCGLFGLFMLRLVGFASVPKEVDLILSGLAVGSGTKPLHDLIANLQQAKENKQDPPEKKGN